MQYREFANQGRYFTGFCMSEIKEFILAFSHILLGKNIQIHIFGLNHYNRRPDFVASYPKSTNHVWVLVVI